MYRKGVSAMLACPALKLWEKILHDDAQKATIPASGEDVGHPAAGVL